MDWANDDSRIRSINPSFEIRSEIISRSCTNPLNADRPARKSPEQIHLVVGHSRNYEGVTGGYFVSGERSPASKRWLTGCSQTWSLYLCFPLSVPHSSTKQKPPSLLIGAVFYCDWYAVGMQFVYSTFNAIVTVSNTIVKTPTPPVKVQKIGGYVG